MFYIQHCSAFNGVLHSTLFCIQHCSAFNSVLHSTLFCIIQQCSTFSRTIEEDVVLVMVVEMKDISQQQGKPAIQNYEYHQVQKVYRKIKLSSGDIEYYLSWANQPAKKYRCWVKRNDLSPTLQKYIDTKRLPCM